MASELSFDEEVLVLLPAKLDQQRTVQALAGSNIECRPCDSLQHLCEEILKGAGAALLTEETLLADPACLEEVLKEEPPWSNFPLVVLTQHGANIDHLPASALHHMTLVERPMRFLTLRSVISSVLRHRRQQYEVRDHLNNLRQAHQELQSANLELENRVQERTARLKETITELEAFSYSISHDLRAPLRSMQGYAEVLMDRYSQNLDDSARLYLSKISAGASRLDLLVQDVLAYSRVAKEQIHLQEVSLDTFVCEVVETYPQLKNQGAIDVSTPLPNVCAHPAYLTQCLSNLIGNAIKFARPHTPPNLTIRAEAEPNPKMVRIWFEDNGIGIAPEHHRTIFEIFGRVHSASAYEGTGIGLAIVRKAVERMGGTVGVISEVGKGSRFWLTLRRAE